MLGFGKSLPLLRKRVDADLGKRGLPREKIIAAVVSLLEHTLIRVGNDEYARDNGSFGLTTLRNRHAKVNASHVSFDFVGKSGKRHRVEFNDRRLATIIQRCHEIPGQHLFAYIDEDGERQNVTSADVNDYIREATGGDFTAKDFRTWTATVLAHTRLQLCGPPETARAANRHVVETVKAVADELRNTAAVCRKCYIHPAVLEGYVPGAPVPSPAHKRRGLSVEESAVLSLLERESTAQKPRPRGRANRAKPAPARTP
jgi:DNA topoisomerase-1